MKFNSRCDVCGQPRNDRDIDVVSFFVGGLYDLPAAAVKRNIRYCAESAECKRKAETFNPKAKGGAS